MSSSIEDLKEIKENLRKKDEGSEVMDTEGELIYCHELV